METITNLAKAFVGESQARNRYTFFSRAAEKEGFEQIAGVFLETAEQEREHASQFYKHLVELTKKECMPKEITTEVPVIFGTTKEHLKAAAEGEKHEHTILYPEFAKVAVKENLPLVAVRFIAISKAEKHHEERYRKLLSELDNGTLFKKEEKITWACRKCGYVHEGNEPPKNCPSCGHERGFFQRMVEEY